MRNVQNKIWAIFAMVFYALCKCTGWPLWNIMIYIIVLYCVGYMITPTNQDGKTFCYISLIPEIDKA